MEIAIGLSQKTATPASRQVVWCEHEDRGNAGVEQLGERVRHHRVRELCARSVAGRFGGITDRTDDHARSLGELFRDQGTDPKPDDSYGKLHEKEVLTDGSG